MVYSDRAMNFDQYGYRKAWIRRCVDEVIYDVWEYGKVSR